MEVFETALPGVGVRYEFTSTAGDRLGVVVRRDSRRELVLYDDDDPDAARDIVELTRDEAAVLVELLGGTKVTERISDLRHEVEGLSIEWVTIPTEGGLSSRTIGDGRIRTLTGASVVAVIRGETSIPGPGPEFVLVADDVALVVGSVEGVQAAARILSG
ncbi:MAG: cation:proton antiporter regulatory subunit [Acidimicrobiia bacterium]